MWSIDFFFFKQKTAYEIKECDWSSDVCSSDLDISDYDDEKSSDKTKNKATAPAVLGIEKAKVFADRKSVV